MMTKATFPILIVAVLGPAVLHAQEAPAFARASYGEAAPSAAPAAGVVEPSTQATEVTLLVGRSAVVEVGSPITRVSLTSSDVADALVTSPSQLLVHGK